MKVVLLVCISATNAILCLLDKYSALLHLVLGLKSIYFLFYSPLPSSFGTSLYYYCHPLTCIYLFPLISMYPLPLIGISLLK